MRSIRNLSFVVAAISLSSALRAQQFGTVTNFPQTNGLQWAEGVECADVDHDGDLDVFVADGNGFSSAGSLLQNILLINKFEVTPFTFADESVARLGVHTSVAKGVTTGDVNGDGWIDALYANAFSSAVPFLYINQGAGNPGFFNMESATRGLTTAFSSGSAQFGDLDDDGDLDLILGDAYNSGTGKPHLFFNNGSGVFTENAAALGAANKAAQMDVQLVDIDNDFDLDFFGINKATGSGAQYLMLNSGSGTFSDVSTLIAVSSGGTYEAEAGDLDGDTDLDLFFVSLSGFSEGAVRNNFAPSGPLTFTNQSALAGSVDDNEIALFDYDNDGDYDALVGSLGTHEYLWRNDGSFSFNNQSAAIQSISDSTLDCTVADLNNDGRYDIITVQGESGTFGNKFYRNTGSVDTLRPVVVAHPSVSSAPAAGPVIAHAKIRDQVLDDGVNYVTGSALYVINTAANTSAASIDPTGFNPASFSVPVGCTVTWTNNSGASQTVTSTTSPYFYDSGTIAPGGTYAHTFVAPGIYNVISGPSGFITQVTVTGLATNGICTYSGGQIYRFRMNDTAAGAGVQLCYELRFVDWAGNLTVADTRRVTLVGPPVGTAFCFGDGSGPFCPCGNLGNSGRGCANSQNSNGALLVANGTTSPDNVVFTSSGELPSVLTIFLQGDISIAAVPFGDGLRCAGGNLKRLYVKSASSGTAVGPDFGVGDANVTSRSAALGDTIPPGGTRYYHAYYRDADPVFCAAPSGNTYNISNGLILVW